MEEDLVPPTAGPMADENRYDNVYDGDVKGRDPERHVYDNATYEMDTTAYDNATYELDTGEQTAVDMPPPPDELVDDLGNVDDADMPPSDEPYDDVVVDAEGDEHPAVIDVSTVDGDAMVEPDDEKEIDVADGDEEPPVYSAGSENTDLYAVPVKSRENSKKYDSVDGVPMTSAGTLSDEEQYRKEKSIKICICLFVIVLIGVIVGLVGFYAVYSMRELYATMNSPTTTTTKATEPPLPIMIDNIAVELNLTFNDFNFTEAYNDPNSTEYKELAAKVLKLLYDTLGSGNITVLEFRPGSIVAVVVIYFDEVPEALVDVLPENNVEVLVNAIGEELVILIIDGLANANESNVDVQIGNVIIEEVPTTVLVTTEASATGMTSETVESTDGTTPTVDTAEETTTAFIDTTDDTTQIVVTTGETTTPIIDTTGIVDTTRTDPTTTVETTTEATCPNGTFSCLEADGKCINNVQRCDFVPDCRVSRADETEELCQVSLLAEDVSVVFRRETTLTTPASYPIRDIDTPLDYILYRITSPPNSHILIELDMVTFSGVDSYLSIGHGHDPVQALYSNGILLTLSNEWPFPLATPDNQAYILLEKAQGENIEININLKAFVCNSEDAIPCRYSDQCYLPSEICDDTQQCQQGEDEEGCPNPLPPFCFNCSTPWENNTCLPSDWVCDETQDCLDNSDEIGCPTTEPCFECESDYGCVYLHWTCDGVEDCYDRADEMNCTDTLGCPNGTFECPEPESTCINSTQLCDFMPDCRATGSDETEDLCMVSQITEDVDVPFNAYRWLVTPNSYPSRDIDTPQDYYLYRLSSPSNSHMLLEIVDVIFTGPESVLTIGSGLDPVQAFYDSGLLLTFDNRTGWNASEPYRLSTPVNEAYVLLEKAPGENLEITIRLSAFECTRPGDIPCSYSNNCYLVSEICDGAVQCTGSQEDELDCSSPTPPFCFNCSTPWENNTCLPYDWVCDGAQDCLDNSDEIDCQPQPCFNCSSEFTCVFLDWVCDGFPDCFDDSDEVNCNTTTTEPCFPCFAPGWDCLPYDNVCDGLPDCLDSTDEANCNVCGADQYPCYFDNTECFNASDVCDGMYDCPGGSDEYNCTGCFACPGSSTCLTDFQICNFFNDCPGGEDEAESLCDHSSFITDIQVNVGEWMTFNKGYVSERHLGRRTPASNFYDFTHYVFRSDPGTTLFVEIQNMTISLTGPLLPLVRVSAGSGPDPTDFDQLRAFADGYGNQYSISNTFNFSLTNNTGNLLIALPTAVFGSFYVQFRVTAIECESPETLCIGSPHCYDWFNDTCDGEVQCLDSGEDEYGCEECLQGLQCYFDDTCYQYRDVCDGIYDCPSGADEFNCTGCFACPGHNYCLNDIQVCDFFEDCPNGEDEAESLCRHSEYITEFEIPTGEWMTFEQSAANPVEDRSTPAGYFYNFIHYVFNSAPGATLYLEVQNVTLDDTSSPLLQLYRIFAGPGEDATYSFSSLPLSLYLDGSGYSHSISNSFSFSLTNNTGYIVVAIPKGFEAYTMIRITAIECESAEMPCIGSPHCYDWFNDTCDGEVQCLDSGEDEYGCEATTTPTNYTCLDCQSDYCVLEEYRCDSILDCYDGLDEMNCTGNSSCFFCEKSDDCIPWDWVCDRFYDCSDASDELNCNTTVLPCFQCTSDAYQCIDLDYVCDNNTNCDDGSDEWNCNPSCFNCTNIWNNATCLPENWICDGLVDCVDESDELFCPPTPPPTEEPSSCFNCTSPYPCVFEPYWVCNGIPECFDDSDEANCNTTTTTPTNYTCLDCQSDYCVLEEYRCDSILDCFDGLDEMNCICEDDQLECYYEETCVQLNETCDGYNDCPGGVDEYNCTGCFSCPGSSDCLYDLQVCDFYNHCLGGEDEAESLCNHLQFINNVQVPTGEWVTLKQQSGGAPNRGTPASDFIEFTHYVFESDPGTTLFMELLNYTWSDGPLVPLLVIYAGPGDDPTYVASTTAYLDGTGYSGSISYSNNFSLLDSTGFGLVAFPKGVDAYVELRVTAIACVSPETACIGSPHCVNWANDTCDGEAQCLYNQEDEFNCDGCDLPCFFDNTSCLYYDDYCDGEYDCKAGEDEYGCPGCFTCPGSSECILDSVVCDFYDNCYGGEDEAESLCRDSEFIIEKDVPTGEWVTIEQRSGDPVENRGTPASKFYDFYHYVFNSVSGTTLFVELQNYTWSSDASPVLPLLRIIAGAGDDPASGPGNRAYFDSSGYSYTISNSPYFSLTNNTGFVALAFPKGVEAYVKFRVTAIACESPETLCNGSPHCVDWTNDTCDGEAQCIDSQEDELNCPEPCFDCTSIQNNTCVPTSWVCDGIVDCVNETDEVSCQCETCFVGSECLPEAKVCDFYFDCPLYEDESEELCQYSAEAEFYSVTSGQPLTVSPPTVYPFTNNPDVEYAVLFFTSTPGTSLFVELQNFLPEGGDLARIRIGSGHDPGVPETTHYFFLPFDEEEPPVTTSLTVEDNKAYVVIGRPAGYSVNVTLKVTEIDACNADQYRCQSSGECILSEFVCNLKQECTNVDDEKSCGYDLISTDVSLGSEQYEVNSVVPVAVGDNIPAALWRFYAPNSSYVLFFDVSSSYTLPDNSEAGIGPGTDFIGGRTVTYYSWGSVTPASKHDFYVPSHEAFVSISIPDESASVSLSFSVTAVQAPDCTGDSSVCVICVPRNQQCVLGLGCSTGTEYFCP